MQLPSQEGLRTVRFDGARAYAITYNQTDPMFVIDLSDPRAPRQRGALYMPGFMFYLEPYGDRVIGLGIDRTDTQGSLNVSLFDVSNARRAADAGPRAVRHARHHRGLRDPEQRSLRGPGPDPEGVPRLPRRHGRGSVHGASFVRRVRRPLRERRRRHPARELAVGHVDQARAAAGARATHGARWRTASRSLAVSDSNVREFSLADVDVAHQTADLVIGTCVPDSDGTPVYQPPVGRVAGLSRRLARGPVACAAARWAAPGRLAAGDGPDRAGRPSGAPQDGRGPVRSMLARVREPLMPDGRRHFSMIREFQLADLVTLLNGFLGAGALLAFMRFTVDRTDRVLLAGHGAFAGGAADGHAGRADRAAARDGVAARARARFAGRRRLVRRGPGRHGLCGGNARRVGRALPDHVRRLRHQPAGALQRHGRRALRPDAAR